MSTTPRSPASLPQSLTWKRATPTRSSSSRADTAGGAIYDAAVKLVNGETLESDTFYMPTFGVGPDELEAKSDEIWTVKYADMLG